MIGMICYKYHYTIDYVLNLSFPQMLFLLDQLGIINKMENEPIEKARNEHLNQSNQSNQYISEIQQNTNVEEVIVKMLKEKTGKESFTMQEVMQPELTLRKYGIIKNGKDKV